MVAGAGGWGRRGRAAAAGGDEGDFKGVAAGGMGPALDRKGAEEYTPDDGGGGGFEEVAAGRDDPRFFRNGLFVHGMTGLTCRLF